MTPTLMLFESSPGALQVLLQLFERARSGLSVFRNLLQNPFGRFDFVARVSEFGLGCGHAGSLRCGPAFSGTSAAHRPILEAHDR